MTRFTKVLAAIILMTAVLFVSGCKPEDDPNNGGGDINDEVINPNYVPIDWNEAVLVASDDNTGDYQIQFHGEMPELQPGSIIAIDLDTVAYYRFIESVSVDGNSVRVTSSEAYLTDIYANTEFTIATSPSQGRGNVCYPTKIYVYNEDGSYRIIDRATLRDDEFPITHDLWQYGENFDNTVLFQGDNYKVYMEKMNFNFDLDLVMTLNFGARDSLEFVNNGKERWKSKAMKIKAELVGSFDTEQKLRCDVWGDYEYSPGEDLWKPNLFPKVGMTVAGPGGVPIHITLRSDLYREVRLEASGEISAYTGIKDEAEGRMGFEWSQQTNSVQLIKSFRNNFEFTPPTVEGKGSVEAKVWAFPRIIVRLYDLAGPSFDFKPYLSTEVSGGFKEEMLGQSNDFCAWSLDCNTGVDADFGLDFGFLGKLSYNLPILGGNVFDKPLYHSPLKLDHSPQTVELEQTTTVSFNVYDTNYLANTDVLTPLPQIVKFEANGELSSEYGFAHKGRVTVDWTPVLNDILYAKLYDIEGNVMAWDTVMAPQEDLFVDLGLPSGTLWATRNVGANATEEYGDYFAWGETEPKSVYSWETYKYGHSWNDLTKYCSNPDCGHNGFVDNLTILQPEDDAAAVNWGGDARMPTFEEIDELYENTTNIWTNLNGIDGSLITGPNGNSIFLPAAGWRWDGELSYIGQICRYWLSSRHWEDSQSAWYFEFPQTGAFGDYRCLGHTVRPVRSVR